MKRARMSAAPMVAAILWVGLVAGHERSAPRPADPVERPPIVGIAHVAFRVSGIPAARRFYGEVLGLEQVHHGTAVERVRFRVNQRQEIVLEPGLPADQDERLSHLAFETSDLDRLAAYLKAHGVATEVPGASAPRCASQALWIKDPDGHPIEFVTREASGTPVQSRGAEVTPAGRAAQAVSTRVLHAGLTVRDAGAADRLYDTILGFSEIWRGGRTDSTTSWINMKVPDGTDYLEYMLISEPADRQQLGVLHHVALLVPDIQAAYETALERTPSAASPIASPQIGRNNRWQLNLFDPDGTRVELMEPFTTR